MRGCVMKKRKMKCRAMRRRGRRMGRNKGKMETAVVCIYRPYSINESGPSAFTIMEPTTGGRSKCLDFKKALTFTVDYKLLQTE